MNYGDIFTRALAISWRHKYLWLLALFAGEAAASTLPRFPSVGPRQNSVTYGFGAGGWEQITAWVGAHAALLWAAGIAALLIFAVLVLASAVADGGLVRGAAEHDGQRPFGLGAAWSAGVRTFGPVLGVKLFGLLVAAALFVLVGSLAAVAAIGGLAGNIALAAGFGVAAAVALLLAVPSWIVLEVVVMLAVRAAVLDGNRAMQALANGFQLIRRRLGRIALVWLLVLVAGLVAGIALAIAGALAALPLAIAVAIAYAIGGVGGALGIGIPVGLVWLALMLALSGGVKAFTSTFWTLAYQRFDLEPQPAAAQQAA